MDEAERIARYAPQGDAEGLAAYALHRRALLAFRVAFCARMGRSASEAEEAAFLLAEEAPERIEAYRREVRALTSLPATPAAKPRPRWPFFGQWVEPPTGSDPEKPVNWRGLAGRLVVLLLAVIVTAILLRVLVVKA